FSSLFTAAPTTAIYTLSPTRRSSDLAAARRRAADRGRSRRCPAVRARGRSPASGREAGQHPTLPRTCDGGRFRDREADGAGEGRDRKSTRLNSSHDQISYAVFCLKKK